MMENMRGLSHLFVTYFLYNFANFVVYPVITDVTMEALCPHQDECSLAIYLTGFQQAITGLGSVFAMPLIGKLSDVYGRKALLTLPFTAFIVPSAILAYNRSTNFFYAYFVSKTLIGMVEGSAQTLALAYVADNISEAIRGSSFGLLIGVGSAGVVVGTVAARFLPTAMTFMVAVIISVIAAVYLQVFLNDTTPPSNSLHQPILKTGAEITEVHCESSKKIQALKTIPSYRGAICLLKSSRTFLLAAFVAFFNKLAYGGLQASMMYYLKALFHYNKDQFADLMLIVNISATITQLIFLPMLVPIVGEKLLVSLGLFAGFVMMLLNSIAWSFWVPLAAGFLCLFYFLAAPSLCSIVSKQVGPTEQGIAQGCISSMMSIANIVSPLVFSPLTALFLSEGAPFDYPGFSMLCIGLTWLTASIVSTMIPGTPLVTRDDNIAIADGLEA